MFTNANYTGGFLFGWNFTMNTSENLTREDIDRIVARLKGEITNIWMWKSQSDAFTCAECAGQDGRLFSGDKIKSMMTGPPLHINCRCTLVPLYKGFV